MEIAAEIGYSYTRILRRRLGDAVRSVALFGSAARGTTRFPQSDIDFFLVIQGMEGASMFQRIDLLSPSGKELSTTTPFLDFKKTYRFSPVIQPHVFTPSEVKGHPPIMLDLLADAKILYDDGTLKKEVEVLRRRLDELGGCRVNLRDGSWYWVLKPNLRFGEEVEL